MPTRRKAKRRLPRAMREAIQEKERNISKAESIPPITNTPAFLTRPPEVRRPPELKPYQDDSNSTALVPTRKPIPTDRLLQSMGQQVLLGQEIEGVCDFWIELKEDILGGVEIRLSLSSGRLSATLFVGSRESEALIQERLPILEKQLINRGLSIKKLDIVRRKKTI